MMNRQVNAPINQLKIKAYYESRVRGEWIKVICCESLEIKYIKNSYGK